MTAARQRNDALRIRVGIAGDAAPLVGVAVSTHPAEARVAATG